MTVPGAASRRRVWMWLGSPGSVRAITVGMIAYALIIGALVVGYARVSGCLARYAEASASSTAARAQAASEDRAIDLADRQIAEVDRAATARADDALGVLLQAMAGQDRQATLTAFETLLKVRTEVADVRAENAEARRLNSDRRAEIERARLSNPVPPPPSQSC
ncbi:hypothetical protein BDK92_7237 [Micromonospora pisi]|uniref:Uncharacterized protein n=1 Tax=Micromonospora pisi TaxID=589240 RepID=A0A495JUR0_9ACTN|nr:hypothetical protein [Micromonospora pisi]RKR92757.1 hypothetical protein BDK92_7237 [Micromonospora pisi]